MDIRCRNCNAVKDEGEFYVSNKTRCMACIRASVRDNRMAKVDYYRSYDRARGNRQPKDYAARYRSQYPTHRAAQVYLNNALRDGRIKAWPVCAIPDCDGRPEAHHTHYDAPLDVVWLCPAHHKQAHAMARKAA
jgi:hypothetical protein